MNANQAYKYSLGFFGDEEGAGISKQATNFIISKTERVDAVEVIYHYQPKTGFTGLDEVTLKSERGSDGASRNNKILYTTIKFTITE